jgi:hypothetical protein
MARPWSLPRLTERLDATEGELISIACGADLPALGSGSWEHGLFRLEEFLLEDVFFGPGVDQVRRLAALGALAVTGIHLQEWRGKSRPVAPDPRSNVVWAAINALFEQENLLLHGDAGGELEPIVVVRCALVAISTVDPGATWTLRDPAEPTRLVQVPVPAAELNRIQLAAPDQPEATLLQWSRFKSALLSTQIPPFYPHGAERHENVILPAPPPAPGALEIDYCQRSLRDVVEEVSRSVLELQGHEQPPEPLEVTVRLHKDGTISLNGKRKWFKSAGSGWVAPSIRNNQVAEAVWEFANDRRGSLRPSRVRDLNSSLQDEKVNPGLWEVQFEVADPRKNKPQVIALQSSRRAIRFRPVEEE